jgi:hypothetical protein
VLVATTVATLAVLLCWCYLTPAPESLSILTFKRQCSVNDGWPSGLDSMACGLDSSPYSVDSTDQEHFCLAVTLRNISTLSSKTLPGVDGVLGSVARCLLSALGRIYCKYCLCNYCLTSEILGSTSKSFDEDFRSSNAEWSLLHVKLHGAIRSVKTFESVFELLVYDSHQKIK